MPSVVEGKMDVTYAPMCDHGAERPARSNGDGRGQGLRLPPTARLPCKGDRAAEKSTSGA